MVRRSENGLTAGWRSDFQDKNRGVEDCEKKKSRSTYSYVASRAAVTM